MLYLIVSLISLCAGFVGARYLVRRHHGNVLFQMQQQTEALRTIMYRTHHQGVNPICKRIRGITSLGRILMKRLPPSSDSEMKMIFDMIDNQAVELENEMLDKVKEFEHLQ